MSTTIINDINFYYCLNKLIHSFNHLKMHFRVIQPNNFSHELLFLRLLLTHIANGSMWYVHRGHRDF